MKAQIIKVSEIFKKTKDDVILATKRKAFKFIPVFIVYSIVFIALVRLFLLVNVDFR